MYNVDQNQIFLTNQHCAKIFYQRLRESMKGNSAVSGDNDMYALDLSYNFTQLKQNLLVTSFYQIFFNRNLSFLMNQIQLTMKKIKRQDIEIEHENLEVGLVNHSTHQESSENSKYQQLKTRATLMDHDPNKQKQVRKAKHAGKTFGRLFGYTWRNKLLLLVANVSLAISAGGMVLLPLLCGQMVDIIRQKGDLMGGSLQFVILTVFMAVFSAIRGYSFNMLGEKILVAMRQQLFDKLIEKDISYYDKNKTGQLLSRLGNDIATVYSVCSDNLSMLIRNFLQFLGSLIFLWVISWKLTLFIIVLTPIISFSLLLVMKVIKRYQKQYSNNIAYANSLATEVFGNIRVVRSFSNQKVESKNYEGLLGKIYEVGQKKNLFYGVMLLVMTTFANFLILSILYFGGQLVIDDELSIGELTSFILYTLTLTIGFASISGILNQTISAIGICQHIFQIMDEPLLVQSGLTTPNFNNRSTPIIQFIDVSFSYPGKPNVQVLKKINLKINHGQSIAVVGPSGSGKSSIVTLILRFYDVNQGKILINGKNIKEINSNSLRQFIGFVSQQPTLFSGSLKQNVQYGLRQGENKDQKVEKALQIANAKQFVYNEQLFPEKLETLVGQRGVKLSGGQKQRIAIARCLAKQPKIMIFDEATSALDAQSEYQVQKAIDGLVNKENKEDRTMIIVAHRLSTIINCDRILVVKNGEIVQQGNHRELLSQKGVYANLVERQLSNQFE